jgi:hypothetical protein
MAESFTTLVTPEDRAASSIDKSWVARAGPGGAEQKEGRYSGSRLGQRGGPVEIAEHDVDAELFTHAERISCHSADRLTLLGKAPDNLTADRAGGTGNQNHARYVATARSPPLGSFGTPRPADATHVGPAAAASVGPVSIGDETGKDPSAEPTAADMLAVSAALRPWVAQVSVLTGRDDQQPLVHVPDAATALVFPTTADDSSDLVVVGPRTRASYYTGKILPF